MKHTIESLRKTAMTLIQNRDQKLVADLLADFDSPSITRLHAGHYQAFGDRLNELAARREREKFDARIDKKRAQ